MAGLPNQIVPGSMMAKFKHAFELVGNRTATQGTPDAAERQLVFDRIVQKRSVGSIGLKSMQVPPAGEWAGHLFVRELPARDKVRMAGFPAQPNRPALETQHDAGAIPDSARLFQNTNRLPGWDEALEGTGPGVPVKDRLS